MPFVRHRKLPRALSLIHNVGDQAQIVLDEHIPGVQIPLFGQGQVVSFLLLRQGPWKAPGGQLQSVQ